MEELADKSESTVEATEEAYAVICVYDTEEQIKLNRQQCLVLLQSPGSVERLVEEMGLNEDDSIILHEVVLPDSVQHFVETSFATVDEA